MASQNNVSTTGLAMIYTELLLNYVDIMLPYVILKMRISPENAKEIGRRKYFNGIFAAI